MGLWDFGTLGLWDFGTLGLWDFETLGLWDFGTCLIADAVLGPTPTTQTRISSEIGCSIGDRLPAGGRAYPPGGDGVWLLPSELADAGKGGKLADDGLWFRLRWRVFKYP